MNRGDTRSLPNKSAQVAHVVLSMEIGGLERLVEQLVIKRSKSGNSVSLYCLDRLGVIGEELLDSGYKVIGYSRKAAFIDFRLLKELKKQVKMSKTSVLHCHNQEALFYSVLIKLFFPWIRIVHSQHGVEPPVDWKKKIKQTILGKFIFRYIGVSKDVTSIARKEYHIANSRLDFILNGVNTDYYSPIENLAFRKRLDLPEDTFVITCVARLATIKNHGLIVDIAALLKKRIKNLSIILVGDGSERESIRAKIERLQLQDTVRMEGEKSNIKDYLSVSDVFLLSSLSEGINVSLLEAMSMAVVPVVTDVGGNAEVIDDTKNGFLVDGFDAENFEEILVQLSQDRDRCDRIGKEARKRVENEFSLGKMYSAYEKLYQL